MASIGIFDSGIGGLSVWRQIIRQTPHANTVYVADQAHLPYGEQPESAVLEFSSGIARFLVEHGCETIVVACNTASAVALHPLRAAFPGVQFVGMEPAVKPAARLSARKIVAVLATPATLNGGLFEATVAGLDVDVDIVRQPCPGLVECIEAGHDDAAVLEPLLTKLLRAPRDAGADTIVLACTHYPLVRDTIERIVGPEVHIVDPAAAVARRVQDVTTAPAPPDDNASDVHRRFFTTGNVESFSRSAQRWLGVTLAATHVGWVGGVLDTSDVGGRQRGV